jgi:hypothetical protein
LIDDLSWLTSAIFLADLTPQTDRIIGVFENDGALTQFSVAPEQITNELLEICDEFFRQGSPIVHTELRQFLTEHGHHGGPEWFLDALSFTTIQRSRR